MGLPSDEITFIASITEAPFVGEIASTTYFVGPPSLLFRDMAESWKGWKGEKVWSALDRELTLSATTTPLGHVTLKIEMAKRSGDFRLCAVLGLKAGQLEQIYKNFASLFPLNDRR